MQTAHCKHGGIGRAHGVVKLEAFLPQVDTGAYPVRVVHVNWGDDDVAGKDVDLCPLVLNKRHGQIHSWRTFFVHRLTPSYPADLSLAKKKLVKQCTRKHFRFATGGRSSSGSACISA
jgi:hypothetical protein